jgi:F5/8 type C domain
VEVRFPARPARCLRVIRLGGDSRFRWTIRELSVYETAGEATPATEAPGLALEVLRAAGVRRLYADHAVGARLAEAAGGGLEILPANVAVDLYGATPPIDVVPRFDPAGPAAIVLPVDLPSLAAVEATLRAAGLAFTAQEVGGYRLLTRVAPAPGRAGAPPPAGAVVTGSAAGADGAAALDGRPETRWSTRAPQQPGDWLQIDLAAVLEVDGIELDLGPFRSDYPRGLALAVARASGGWEPVAATVTLSGPLGFTGTHLVRLGAERVHVSFPPVRARALRLVQTAREGVFDWSVAEIRLRTR